MTVIMRAPGRLNLQHFAGSAIVSSPFDRGLPSGIGLRFGN